jgi:Acetyltransferase (GNAT) domain
VTVRYHLLAPSDAQLLCAGIERVYGDTYPIPEFYDESYLHDAIAASKLHCVVAQNDSGEVVGCMSTVLEYPDDVTADGSALMISPEYRGQGIVAQLGHHSADVYQRLRLSGLHLYALALHDLVQNQVNRAGGIVTGVLPAWFSRKARVAGYDYPDARIGAVTLFMPLGELPARRCYLPDRYGEILRDIYSNVPGERELLWAPAGSSLAGKTEMAIEEKLANGQRRAIVSHPGSDFAEVLGNFVVASTKMEVEVNYVDIPLSHSGSNMAVDIANAAGFFFGALKLDRGGCDRLRLQRYAREMAAPEHMVAATEEARALLSFVQADRQR